jgi:hypothetical protein
MSSKEQGVIGIFIVFFVLGILWLVAKIGTKLTYSLYYKSLVEQTIQERVLKSCVRKHGYQQD